MSKRITFSRTAGFYTGNKDAREYTQSYAGNALAVLFLRGTPLPSDLDPKNLIARGSDFSYRESYQLLPVIEWNTYFIQELVIGMQEMGNFEVRAVFNLRLNDALPSVKTLAWELDNTVLEHVGDEHPNSGIVVNAFYGQRFGSRGHAWTPTGLLTDTISGLYRYRLPGKEYKLKNPSSKYPAPVKEVSLDGAFTTTPAATN